MSERNRTRLYDAIAGLCFSIALITAFVMLYVLVVYPAISRRANEIAMLAAITAYAQDVSQLSQAEIDMHLYRAYRHNAELALLPRNHQLMIAEWANVPEDYTDILNIGGTIARLEIASIGVNLPVLHGTGPESMMNGVGHLEGTAFPIGGYSTHSVLMTHSGKRTAPLFSRLHELDIGDTFVIYVLDRRLVYEVDHIIAILPYEIEHLRVVPDADMVTLITCTPILVNTHRLLVRGVRCPAHG